MHQNYINKLNSLGSYLLVQRVEVAVSMVEIPVVALRHHIDPIDYVRRRLLANFSITDHDVANLVVVCARSVT